jgi:hypothetical protein
MLLSAARSVAAAFEVVVDAYGTSPLATHALADRARDAYWDRAEKNAMADPEYAAIEAHRHDIGSGPGPLPDTSNNDNISWDDFETQLRISSRITPTPPWWPFASFVADRPIRRLAGRARTAYQLANRGWADSDHWELGINLCGTLAGQLNNLADSAWGWPGPPNYPEPNDWTTALRAAAEGLSRWATHEHSPDGETPSATIELTGEAKHAAATGEARKGELLLVDAQEALRWVANNLRDLWD